MDIIFLAVVHQQMFIPTSTMASDYLHMFVTPNRTNLDFFLVNDGLLVS